MSIRVDEASPSIRNLGKQSNNSSMSNNEQVQQDITLSPSNKSVVPEPTNTTPNSSILDSPEYQQFLKNDFNVISYTSNVLKISSISTSLEKLSVGKQEITQELNSSITENYQHLFNQASNIRDFENETQHLKTGLRSLEESIMRMRKDISEPYLNIKSQITQLKRVQDTCELLRVVIRYLSLIKKLKIHLKDGRDLAKAAQSIHEIDTIRKENNLSGINIIDQQVEWLNRCKEQVVTTAGNLLLQGMDTQNQSEVANSLQVFYNLGILVDRVNSVVNTTTERVTKSMKTMLNVNKLVSELPKSPSSSPSSTTTDQSVWSKIEAVTNLLYTSCIQIWQLQRVLSKIRDPITNKTLMDVVQQSMISTNNNNTTNTSTTSVNSYNISLSFWRTVTKSLETNLSVAAKSSNIIENTFILEYPKISRYFQEFSKRLLNYCDLQQGIVGISLEDHQLLFKAIAIFEKGYLERTRDRMLAILNAMFPQSTWSRGMSMSGASNLPTSKQLVDLSKVIWSEIESIENNPTLLVKVSKVLCSGIDLFAGKIDALVVQGAQDAITIDSKPTVAQSVNFSLFNSTTQLQNSIQSLLSSHTFAHPDVSGQIERSLQLLGKICQNILTPFSNMFLSGVEQIIGTIHQEEWSNDNAISASRPCSNFMETLQFYITHFHTHFLSKFTPCQILSQQVRQLGSKIFTLFIRHASLLKPISEKGRLRLANDLTHLELSVTPLIPEGIKEVGISYTWIRTFRHFIFKDLTGITTLKNLPELNSLPLIIIAHILIGKGPKEMIYPNQLTNWTIHKYVHWLDEHSDMESLQLVKMALDAYAKAVNKKGEKEFSYLYPLLLGILPKSN